MKNKFTKIISSVLILTLLLSCFTVFSFAAFEDETEEEVSLLIQRAYNEGWSYSNGFSTLVGGNKFAIEYEETEDYEYNYFTRVEATSANEGYFEFKYGTNVPGSGNSILEVDLKTDDDTDLGLISYFKGSGKTYSLISINDNKLYIADPGSHTPAPDAKTVTSSSYLVGAFDDEWIHLAFVFTVNRRRCPNCSKVYTIIDQDNSSVICCEGDGGKKVSEMDTLISARIYFGNTDTFDYANALNANNNVGSKDLSKTYYIDTSFEEITSLEFYRFGVTADFDHFGNSYLVDNFKVYNNYSVPTKFPADQYGVNVDTTQAKTEQIISGSNEKTSIQYIESGLVMKVGADWCLDKNERRKILDKEGTAYGAPVIIDGETFVPLQAILDWIDFPLYAHKDGVSFDISTENGSTIVTIGRTTAVVNGQTVPLDYAPGYATDKETGEKYIVIAMTDVENIFDGYHVTYDEMGLICISDGQDLFSRGSDEDLEIMIDVMKRFVYESKTESQYYDEAKEFTSAFTHPYLIATQADFDALHNAYKAKEGDAAYDAKLKAYIDSVLKEADAIYAEFGLETPLLNAGEGVYKYLKEEILNPHAEEENNDYDMISGRLVEAAEYNKKLRVLAIAHQITRSDDAKYAHLAYEFALSMGKWTHWGPAYFVDCAEATGAYALAYDWLYNDWKELGYNLADIEMALYEKGIYMGYRSSTGQECQYLRNEADLSGYIDSTTSWNVISTSGMVIGSLALLGIDDITKAEGRGDDVYADYTLAAKYLLENNIKTLIAVGLDLYAPDGAFIEGVDYWAYATEALTLMSKSLETTIGDDLGLMNSAGVDKGFYSALYTEFSSHGDYLGEEFDIATSKGYHKWNYHNSLLQDLTTDMFFFAADSVEDNALAAIRIKQLAKKTPGIWDVLGYKTAYSTLTMDNVDLALDFKYDSLEAVVSRSDWDDDGIFVGLMGNDNSATGGQVDSGNFIYASKSFTWFTDLGAEDYRVKNFADDAYRYGYYRNNAEGNNTVLVYSSKSSMPYGQNLEGEGVISEYYVDSEGNGMYAILDNSDCYTDPINSAHRGLLFTHDKSTVVIHDEINSKSVQLFLWSAHTGISEKIYLEEDGRTAYLRENIDGEMKWIRVSLVSPYTSMKFTVSDCYSFYLNTYDKSYSKSAPERERSMFQKLTIDWESQQFEAAIVIQEVEDDFDETPVKYQFTKLNDWSSDMVGETYKAPESNSESRGNPSPDHIVEFGVPAYKLATNGDPATAFTNRTQDFYYNMVYAAAAIKTYGHTEIVTTVKDRVNAMNDYYVALSKYNKFMADVNFMSEVGSLIATYVAGYNG